MATNQVRIIVDLYEMTDEQLCDAVATDPRFGANTRNAVRRLRSALKDNAETHSYANKVAARLTYLRGELAELKTTADRLESQLTASRRSNVELSKELQRLKEPVCRGTVSPNEARVLPSILQGALAALPLSELRKAVAKPATRISDSLAVNLDHVRLVTHGLNSEGLCGVVLMDDGTKIRITKEDTRLLIGLLDPPASPVVPQPAPTTGNPVRRPDRTKAERR